MSALLQLMEAQAQSVNFLRDDSTPLTVAAQTGQLGWVEALLDSGADTIETNRAGMTALSLATQRGESVNAHAICAMLEEAADLGVNGWMSSDHSFEFDVPKCDGLGDHIHLHETCVNVDAEFQPYTLW